MAGFSATRESSGLSPELEELAERVIGAAIEVHRHLGAGLPESVCRNALSHELSLREIRHVCEAPLPVMYKGKHVGEGRMDILVDGKLVVELKVVEDINDVHVAQCIAYLVAGEYQLALLINFNVSLLKNGIHRVIRSGILR